MREFTRVISAKMLKQQPLRLKQFHKVKPFLLRISRFESVVLGSCHTPGRQAGNHPHRSI